MCGQKNSSLFKFLFLFVHVFIMDLFIKLIYFHWFIINFQNVFINLCIIFYLFRNCLFI